MIFKNVAEVFDSVEQSRLRLYERVEGLSEEQAMFRPADGVWSVAEITEHLSLFESLLLKLISGMVEKGEATAAPIDADQIVAPISIEQLAGQVSGKAKAPDNLLPTGAPLEKSIESLRQTREALLAFKLRLQSRDFTPVTYTNEKIGALNPYQLLAFIGYHEDRHVAQVSDLISNESFPARQAASA